MSAPASQAQGLTHARQSPAHEDPLEAIQLLTDAICTVSGSYATPYASSPFAFADTLQTYIAENPVPKEILTAVGKKMQQHRAMPLAYGPVEGSEHPVLHIAINAERSSGVGLRPVNSADPEDLLHVTTITHDLRLDAEHVGDSERIVYLLFTDQEFKQLIEHKEGLGKLQTPPFTLVQDIEPARLFLTMLKDAIAHGASDVHIEPNDSSFRIRLRVDGVLTEYPTSLHPREAAAFISHIKVRAKLDISEKRREQTGVILFNDQSEEVEARALSGVSLRISTMPTLSIDGDTQSEACVLRIARRTTGDQFQLEKLGYSPQQLAMLRRNLNEPDGLILLTGPTGSGKTTTLYSCLMELNDPSTKIVTAEHPVEVRLPGIVQTPAVPEIGNTFEYLLRGFLRQDPDIIMIGEIRDRATADAAVSAVTTGHQVFSTMHVTRAAEVVTRLAELGIAPSQMIASLRLCIAQRLVRVFDKRLTGALEAYDARDELNSLAGRNIINEPFMAKRIVTKAPHTHDILKGRTCVSEMWELGDASKTAILSGVTDAIALQRIGIEHDGLVPMFVAGLKLVRQGITSIEELRRTVLSGRDIREHADLVLQVAREP